MRVPSLQLLESLTTRMEKYWNRWTRGMNVQQGAASWGAAVQQRHGEVMRVGWVEPAATGLQEPHRAKARIHIGLLQLAGGTG